MHQIFRISVFVFTLILSKSLFCQVVWQENFDVPDKGVWADSLGNIHTDMSDIKWNIDYSECVFSNETDYAKTVETAGGRFEVLDSDGEVVWASEKIDISTFDAVNVLLDASETGSSTDVDKKYLKAFFKLDGSDEIPFSPENEALGNWGVVQFTHMKLMGDTLQLVVRMNSSYANDKVILDNITVEAIDSSTFAPDHIKILVSPLFAFSEDSTIISVAAFNKNETFMVDSNLVLNFQSTDISVINSWVENGIYYWTVNSKTYGSIDYTITDAKNSLPKIDSTMLFFYRKDAKLIENFESNSTQGWRFNPDWEISAVEPISGKNSVKHALKNITGTSELSYTDKSFRLAEEEFLFSFKLKNGNWDPSNSNLFYLWLKTKNEETLNSGYAIGVNTMESSDLLSLWKMNKGVPVALLVETQFDWNENTTAQIDVMRSALGNWNLNVTNLETGQSNSVSVTDDEFQVVDELSLVFAYTSTRAGSLWFDDLVVIGQNSPPFISMVKTIAEGTFQVFFNEDIKMDLLTVSNLKLTSSSGVVYTIQSIEKVGTKSVILHTNIIPESLLKVTISAISDLDGKTTNDNSYEFENVLPAKSGDVIINEIMADPNPVVGLPEAEYIEIVNRSNHFIQLENWVIFVRNTNFILPKKIISPGEYLIICDDEFGDLFLDFGNVLTMKTFPALLNAGTIMKISNPDGVEIDQVTYSDEWYFDSKKLNGGYSLERIDMNRFCGQWGNWIASVDEKGGTPGTINSVMKENIDVVSPVFTAIDIVSYNELQLIFNEPLDSTVAQLTSNYIIQGLPISKVVYQPGKLTADIYLSNPMRLNTEYELIIHQMVDECGNVAGESSLTFTMVTLREGQVLINEVLFNPYTNGSDFVELYNNSGLTLDLADLRLATRDDSLKLKSVYKISSLHAPFKAGEILAFAKDTLSILENYSVPFPDHLIQVSSFPAFNNEEGRVVLLNDSLIILDEFAYSQNMQSDWLTSFDGVSLERLSIQLNTNDPSNWQSASSLVGYATPGYKNSQTDITPEQKLKVELESDVVSPNGDGYNDELIIRFLLDQPGYLANVYIFNAAGKEVRRLTNNDLIGNNLEVVYDLRNSDGNLMPMGAYVIFTELVHLNVKKKVFKNAFLITDRL